MIIHYFRWFGIIFLLFSGHIRQHQRLPCDNAVFIGQMVDRKDIVQMTDIAIKLKTDPIERLPVPDRVRAAGLQVCDRIVLSRRRIAARIRQVALPWVFYCWR